MDDNKRTVWRPLKGTLFFFLVLGILGVVFFFWKYDAVFPAAALELKLSKEEISSKARDLCKQMDYDTEGCVESTTFGERNQISTFLEHEYSIKEANAFMRDEINVFFWYTRFCRPKEEEEFQVWLDPSGKLVALNHDLEKEKEIKSVSQDEAMQMALKFVKDKTGVTLFKSLASLDEQKGEKIESKDPDSASEDEPAKLPRAPPAELIEGIKLIKHGSVKQSKRTDHYFTWEDQNKDYKGGHIRTSVGVSGNVISSYDCELHVPEAFERKFADMRSYNDLLKSFSYILFAVVGAAMFFAMVWALSTRNVRWRLVLIASAISFVVELLDYWNNWSSIIQQYSTTESLQGYLAGKTVSSLLAAVMAALGAACLIGGIEAVYRKKFQEKIAGESFLKLKALSNRTVLETIIAGICVFGIHLGYVALYYLLGAKMGVWSPLEVRDVGALSNISPAFASFAVGVNASVSEELLYRVLCFVLAQMLLKNFWLANLVQAAGWAFMHSDYPQEPAYARGLELTIVGLFYGCLMRRYGVVAGIISHFIYDAFLGVTPLLLSSSLLLKLSGLAACLPPFVALGIGLGLRFFKGEDLPSKDLLNENVSNPPAEHAAVIEEEKALPYKGLSKKVRLLLLSCCLLSILLFAFLHPRKMGSWAKMTVSRAQAIEIARKFLKERGVEEGDWKVNALLNVNIDDEEVQYGYEKEGYKKTEQIMKAARIPLLWWVRFYKPHQRREYDVVVSAEGRATALNVTLEEDAPGKNPGQDEACKMAEAYLTKYRPEFLPLKFESVLEQKRKNRTDYSVQYVVPEFKMGEARLKISVDTVGERVSFPHVSWDIPDSWRFERNKQTIKDHVAGALSKLLALVVFVLLIWWSVGVFRSQAIHWRAALIAGGLVAVISFISKLNELAYNLMSYDTDVPYSSFITQLAIRYVVSAISSAAVFSVLFALGHGAFRILFPGVSLMSLWHSLFRPDNERVEQTKQMWVDACYCAYAWMLGLGAVSLIHSYLEGLYSPDVLVQPLHGLVDQTHYFAPALDAICNSLMIGFASICLAPALVGIYLKFFRSGRKYFLVSIIFLLLLGWSLKHWQDSLISISTGLIDLYAIYYWVRHCARNNPLAYFLVGALSSLAQPVAQIYKFASSIYTFDMYILIVLFLLPLLLPFVYRKKPAAEIAEASARD